MVKIHIIQKNSNLKMKLKKSKFHPYAQDMEAVIKHNIFKFASSSGYGKVRKCFDKQYAKYRTLTF